MNEFLNQVFLNNPVRNYIQFAFIILIVLIFNKFISKLIGRLIYKLFGKFSEPGLATDFVRLLLFPIELFVVLIALLISSQILNYPEVLDFTVFGYHSKKIFIILYKIFGALSITWILLRIMDFIFHLVSLRAVKSDNKVLDQLLPFLKDFLKVCAIIFAIVFILGVILNFNVTSLLAGLGIGGIAIAFAAQDSLANLLSSIFIFLDRPFIVGDFVAVGDVQGTVEKVGFRSTRIRTVEKTLVTVPNRKITESPTDNLTTRPYRRVRQFIGLTYDTKPSQISAIVADIQDVINKHAQTSMDGITGFHEFGPSALEILVQYYVEMMPWNNYVKIKEELNFKIMEIIENNNAKIAFPTSTVHLLTDKSQGHYTGL